MVRLLVFGLAASALISPASSAEAMTSSEYAEGGALDSALASLGEVMEMAKEEVMTQLEKIAWEDIIEAATETIQLCKEKADGYFEASNSELSEYYNKINWTYVETEAEKALSLSVEAKEVATIFAQQAGEDGIKLTRKQVKFLTSEFLKLYASIDWAAIEEFLEAAKKIAIEKASDAATKSGEAAQVVTAKTAEIAAVAAEQAGPVVEQARTKAAEVAFIVEPNAPAKSRSSGTHLGALLVPMALLVVAGLVWRPRSRAAYLVAKAEGGEPAQSMI